MSALIMHKMCERGNLAADSRPQVMGAFGLKHPATMTQGHVHCMTAPTHFFPSTPPNLYLRDMIGMHDQHRAHVQSARH